MKKNFPGTSKKRKSTNTLDDYFGKAKEAKPTLPALLDPLPALLDPLPALLDPLPESSTSLQDQPISISLNSSDCEMEFVNCAKLSTDLGPVPCASTTQEVTKNRLCESSVEFTAPVASEQMDSISGSINNLVVYDVGLYVGKQVDKFTKFNLINNHWQPPKDYNFPFSVHKKCGKEVKRFLGRNHLENWHWLELSNEHKGLYCKYCVLFSQEYSGHNKGVLLQSFVTKPVTSFAKLLGKDGSLQNHEATIYHRQSVEAGKNFVKSYLLPSQTVANQVNTQRMKQILENRERLKPIIESLVFLGRQNIPLRGHRDDGQLLQQNTSSPVNEGNFRELLRFKIASGDEALKRHLETSSSKATYIGKNTQNQLIDCCGEEIRAELVQRVQKAGCFGIIFDETTDLAHVSQLSLTLRYIHNGKVREDFIAFIDAHESLQEITECAETKPTEPKITGEKLGTIVVNLIKKLSLDILKCVGIGTDNCSVMSSEVKGAVSKILKEAIHAVRCPCLNHGLNNSLSKSNKVQCVRNSVGIIKSVVEFFSASAKRNSVLKKTLKERNIAHDEFQDTDSTSHRFQGTQLPGLCETRWVERHDSVIKFKSTLPSIVEALEEISEWSDLNSSSKANSLKRSLCDVQFICSLLGLIDILQQTLPLSRMLQAPALDLKKASDLILDTVVVLENNRKECDDRFNKIFNEVEEICSDLNIDTSIPRVTGRQKHRSNYTASTPEEYFRKSIYVPLLDNVVNDLKDRFPNETLECFGLKLLIPTNLVEGESTRSLDEEELLSLVERFSPILNLTLGCGSAVQAELNLWRAKWIRMKGCAKDLPATALDSLDSCDEDVYPSLNSLLKIFATLPVSVASAERSFSTLRRLKSWMRTRMGEERLCGLCLLHTHRDIDVDINSVIDRFANSGNRKIEFVV